MNKIKKTTIWIINHYAIPPREAGGTRHFDIANELVRKFGCEVYIIASKFNHLSKKYIINKKGIVIENINGVNFVWIDTIAYKKNNWKRVVNIVQFMYKVLFFQKKIKVKKPDIIIGSTVHPFAALASGFLAKKNKCDFVFEIRDLWPQTFIDMRLWTTNSWKSRIFRQIEKKTVEKSQKLIVLSPLTSPYLKKNYNIDDNRILYLPNSVVLDNFSNTIYQKKRKNKISIIYVGGIDVVHGLETLFEAAKDINDEYKNKIEIHIVGDGKKRNDYINLTKNISIIKWHKPVAKFKVPEILKSADVLFLSTGKVLYGSENKLAEYLAAGRPLLVSTEGDHNNPINEIECGISVKPNDVNALVKAIIAFYNIDNEILKQYAENSRKLAENRFSIKKNTKKLVRFLNSN